MILKRMHEVSDAKLNVDASFILTSNVVMIASTDDDFLDFQIHLSAVLL